LAAGFSQWLQKKRITAENVSWEHPAEYLRHRSRQQYIAYSDPPSLKQFMEFLCRGGMIAAEKTDLKPATPVEQCVQAFEIYLRDQRALAVRTVSHYGSFIRSFLTKRFGSKAVKFGALQADDVSRFVRRESLHMQFKWAKLMTTALRSFFQFARYRGDITADLAAAVPSVAGWSMNAIPRAIPADEVRKLMSRVDRRSAKGRRDYAILLLLARLGLRSSEVTFLDLDDIDWAAGCLTVRGKGRHTRLPLPAEVGTAIVAYLRYGRPRSTSRRLFLRHRAPFHGFRSPTSIAGIVRFAIERAGVNAPTRGAHQFRHALATQMLHHGASLKEIGELLGHRSIEATKIYAKVDIDALRTLALPWPGGME
jgi:site-specific recombinase XerD